MARVCLLYTVLTNPLGAGHSQYRGLYFILFLFTGKAESDCYTGERLSTFLCCCGPATYSPSGELTYMFNQSLLWNHFLRRFLCWGHHFPECWEETGFLEKSKNSTIFRENLNNNIRTYHVCCNDVRWTSRQAIYEWRKVFIINYEPKGRCIQQAR